MIKKHKENGKTPDEFTKKIAQNNYTFDPFEDVFEVFQETLQFLPSFERIQAQNKFKKRMDILKNYIQQKLTEIDLQFDAAVKLKLAEKEIEYRLTKEEFKKTKKELETVASNAFVFVLILVLVFYAGYLIKG